MSYFGIPRKKQDSDEDYTVTLKRGERQPDGTYKDVVKEISSEELAAAIKEAKKMKEGRLTLEVSEKLLRNFSSHDGKAMVSMSVPIYNAEQKKEVFYNIVINESNVSDAEREGYKKVSISADYEYTAKRGVKNESGGYDNVEMKISGDGIKEAFADSKSRYQKLLDIQAGEGEASRKGENRETEEAAGDMQAAARQQEANFRQHRRGR